MIELKKYSIFLNYHENTDDILIITMTSPISVDLAIAKEVVAFRLEYTKNKKHYLVLDVSKVKNVTAEAKEYMQKAEAGLKNILGAAFIANNPVAALIANIFVKTPKNFEAKFFSNSANALKWIIQYKERNGNGI